jgi:hypothetical protein
MNENYALKKAAGANTLSLLNAQLKSQEISQADHLAKTRAIRSEDLALKVSDAKKMVEITKIRLADAEALLEVRGEDDLGSLKARASAIQAVADAEAKLDEFTGVKLLDPALVKAEDLARTLQIEASLRGIVTTARNLTADAGSLESLSTMGPNASGQAKKLTGLDRERDAKLASFAPKDVGNEEYEWLLTPRSWRLQTYNITRRRS